MPSVDADVPNLKDAMPRIRKGQVAPFLPRAEFRERFYRSHFDPAFDAERDALQRIERIAWKMHGDVSGIEAVRRALSGWLDWMGLASAGDKAHLDRFIGYYEPYATSHEALDRDHEVQEEMRNAARTLAEAVADLRAGRTPAPGADLKRPRPK